MPLFRNESVSLLLCRLALSFSWTYQGMVPKIICQSDGEAGLLSHIIADHDLVCQAIVLMGFGEILFGVLLLVTRSRWLFVFNIVALAGLLGFVAFFEPAMLTLPFNPLTLNVALIALSVIAMRELSSQP